MSELPGGRGFPRHFLRYVRLKETNSAAANTALILAALTLRNEILLPDGLFQTNPISLPRADVIVRGVGMPQVNADRTALVAGTGLTSRISLNNFPGITIRDLGFHVTGGTDGLSGGSADLDGEQRAWIENICILGSPGGHGILLSSGGRNTIHNIQIYKMTHGLALRSSHNLADKIYAEDCAVDAVVIKAAGVPLSAHHNTVHDVHAVGTTPGSQGAAVYFNADDGRTCEHNNVTLVNAYNAVFAVRFGVLASGTVQHNSASNITGKNCSSDGVIWESGILHDNGISDCLIDGVGAGNHYAYANVTSYSDQPLRNCRTTDANAISGDFDNPEINGSSDTDYIAQEVLIALEAADIGVFRQSDNFTTPVAAGDVHGTASEPGPDERFAIDTNDMQSITADGLTVAGSAAVATAGDPGTWLNRKQRRRPGLIMTAEVTKTLTSGIMYVGWNPTKAGLPSAGAIRLGGSGAISGDFGSTPRPAIDVYTAGETLRLAVALLDNGAQFFVKHGAGPWMLRDMSQGSTSSDVWACIANFNAVYKARKLNASRPAWLAKPYINDGFGGAFGSSDGLGGLLNTGIAAGGAGMTWTPQIGTWANTGGRSVATALSGGQAVATVDAGTKDVYVSVNLIRASGSAGLVLRWTDINNHIRVYHDGTNIKLDQVVGGAVTTKIPGVVAYSADARAYLWLAGNEARVMYNTSLAGFSNSLDASLTGTKHGLYTTVDTVNTYNNFYVYASGAAGEYAELDKHYATT